jgi:hypothetical protein
MMPDKNTFILTCEALHATIYTTPTNWEEMEMGLSIEQFAVKREVTTTLSFIGDAADLILSAREANADVQLTLNRIDYTDWTTPKYRTWKADMSTYKRNGGVVSVGFASSTARDEIEKNRGTKYEIPLPSTHILDYTGIDRDATNMVSGIVKNLEDSSSLHYSPDNWIIPGKQSQAEIADITIDNFKILSDESQTFNIRVKLGDFRIRTAHLNGQWPKLILAKYSGNTLVSIVHQWQMYLFGLDATYDYYNTNTDNTYTIWPNGTETLSVAMTSGQDLRLIYNDPRRPSSIYVSNSADIRFEVVTNETSDFVDYPVQTMTVQDTIAALLAKMCTVPPLLTYSLPDRGYTHVLTSSQGLTQANDPVMNISFDDVMKHLLCTDGADYEVTDDVSGDTDDTIITIAPASTFKSSSQATTLVAVSGIETSHDPSLVFGTVKVGFETDDDAENGTFDPICTNTFKLGNSDNELDLVSPFKGSPTTIESFLRDKNASSSTTKESDNSVFVFATGAFTDNHATLYRSFTIVRSPNTRMVNNNFYNIPFTPMRMLIANGAWLKVSKWNDTTPITFLSTDRTAAFTTVNTVGTPTVVFEDNGTSSALLTAMTTPLYRPEKIDFDCFMPLWSKTELNTWPRKYFTVTDEKTDEVYNLFVFDLTLPLTRENVVSFSGVVRNLPE